MRVVTNNSAAPSRDPTYDPLWKIRPVIEIIRQAQNAYTPGEHISVDESMIGTKVWLSSVFYPDIFYRVVEAWYISI